MLLSSASKNRAFAHFESLGVPERPFRSGKLFQDQMCQAVADEDLLLSCAAFIHQLVVH